MQEDTEMPGRQSGIIKQHGEEEKKDRRHVGKTVL